MRRSTLHIPRPAGLIGLIAIALAIVSPPSALGAQTETRTAAEPGSPPHPGAVSEIEEAGAFAPAPKPGTLFLHPERFEKKDGTLGAVERGVLFVPDNREEGEGRRVIGLEFWRFRAADDAPGDAPPIFVLHGGPGWPGLEGSLEREGYYEEQIEPLIRIADVVVVGQRGIGASKPNTLCEAPPPVPDDVELAEEEEVRRVREAAKRCRHWWTERGLDLTGLTVVQAAADVDDVRRALGYDKITIWGGSFGSHWGMAVMRFHPEIVERAILSGMEGPNHTYDSPTGILNALSRIAADAEDAPELQGFIPDGGLIAALRATIERLEEQPVTVTTQDPDTGEQEEVRLDAEVARAFSDGYLGRIGDRRREASWPAGVLALYRGDYTYAARRLAGRRGGGGGGSWTTASFFMLDCGSGITPERESQLLSDPARQVVGEQNWFYRAVCPAWDADLGDDFRQNFDTEIPTVIVHGDWDLSTPLENALELVPHFENGKFVRVKRGSHGAMGEAIEEFDWFRESLARFAASGDMSGIPEQLELPEPDWVLPEELEKDPKR